MNPLTERPKRKKAFNLTLDTELVARARTLDHNLSAMVERLLEQHIAQEARLLEQRARVIAQNMSIWNAFEQANGSFADEHSTL